jgi:hypothetical protein
MPGPQDRPADSCRACRLTPPPTLCIAPVGGGVTPCRQRHRLTANGGYTQRLVAVAAVLADREDDVATAFARLAVTAEVRIEVLASS